MRGEQPQGSPARPSSTSPSAVLPVGGPGLLGVWLDVCVCWEAGRTGDLSEPAARPVSRLSVIFGSAEGDRPKTGNLGIGTIRCVG